MLTGEYAVLDGAPALMVAVDRRVVATRRTGPRGSSEFLLALGAELARRYGADHPATRALDEIVVNSSQFYDGTTKLGIGSSAAVTVAATALALAAGHERVPVIDQAKVLEIASAAHAAAQGPRGARGSGADIAAAVHGGVIAFQRATPDRIAWPSDAAQEGKTIACATGTAERLAWPAGVAWIPFFTGASADTGSLVAAVNTAREQNRAAVEAALAAIDKASRAACQACAMRAPEIASSAFVAALVLAGRATAALAHATGLPLVPSCVTAARAVLARFGGTAKTTGAGGGDIGIAVIPGTEHATEARRLLIEAGCQPLVIAVDQTGVDLQPDAQ